MAYGDNTIGEIVTPSNIKIEVRYEYDAIRLHIFTSSQNYVAITLTIQDPEDGEALAAALENPQAIGGISRGSVNVNIDQQQSVSITRDAPDDIRLSIGRDDDYLDVYLPHLSAQNCVDLARHLRAGVEKLQAHQDEEAERHLARRR